MAKINRFLQENTPCNKPAEFLARQDAHARYRLKRSARQMRESASTTADPRNWFKHHPWLTGAAIAAVGLLVVSRLMRPRRAPANRKRRVAAFATGKVASLLWRGISSALFSQLTSPFSPDRSTKVDDEDAFS